MSRQTSYVFRLVLCRDIALECHDILFMPSSQFILRHSHKMSRHSSIVLLSNLHDLCCDRDLIIATNFCWLS